MGDKDLLEFSRVYEAYHARVVALAARIVGQDEAPDVAQEIFAKIDRSLGSLGDPSKLTSWVYAIALNALRDAIRRRAASPAGAAFARRDDGDEDPIAGIADAASRTPEEAAMRSEMVACYLDYVGRLPAKYHEAYALREIEDLSNEEIATRLSLPVGTVKMRLHRARAMLHEQLRRECALFCTERGELMGEPKDRHDP